MQDTDDTDEMSDLNRKIIIAIPEIAAVIKKHTQNDFKHYKTTTLTRRIRRRILVLKLSSVDEYIERLQSSREEVFRLFRDLLISVTAFFRDADAFDSLARGVLTPLVNRHDGDSPLRIWVPGCASGQEAYSIAILLAETMQRCGKQVSVQIFASDLDERALSIARSGAYPLEIQDEVTAERLERFFTKRGKRYFVNKNIRDMIVFSAHNLISDPPFTKVDLISCRNLLIYLGAHLQKKLIPLFHYSLQPGGYLFLGPSETLSVNRELFRTLHTKHRIYQRRVTALDRPHTLEPPVMNLNRFGSHADAGNSELDLFRYSQQVILSEFSPQWIVCDDEGQIHSLSSDPAPFLKIAGGNFKNNIITMAHENLRTGLRAAFSESKEHRRRALSEGMSIPVEGGIQRVHITVQPMPEMGSDQSLHLVVFHRIGTPLQASIHDDSIRSSGGAKLLDSKAGQVIEQLELELLRARDALERTVQELEASNEELKSSNEELLSMNEEMQSANEELETSKEELQTSNENLVRSNNDIQNLLRSTRIATVFLDEDLCIRSFTPAVKKIYDLRESDVGRKLTKFASEIEGMPPLPDPRSLDDDDELEHVIGQIAGRTYIRRVTPYRASDGEHDGIVVTFSDVTELSDSQELFKTLVDVAAQIVWTTNADGRVVEDSPSWRAFTGQTYDQWAGSGWANVVHCDDRDAIMQAWKRCVDNGETLDHVFRLRHHSGDYRWTQVRAAPTRNRDGSIRRWVGMNIDVHDRIMAETNLRRSEELVRTIAENSTNALIMMDEHGYLTYCNQACLEMTGF
ncbi:signal transduction histidine kinase with CheB and CheR activity, partial [Rhodopirellula maiorica SM1]